MGESIRFAFPHMEFLSNLKLFWSNRWVKIHILKSWYRQENQTVTEVLLVSRVHLQVFTCMLITGVLRIHSKVEWLCLSLQFLHILEWVNKDADVSGNMCVLEKRTGREMHTFKTHEDHDLSILLPRNGQSVSFRYCWAAHWAALGSLFYGEERWEL